mmetsp:Transcript_18173/g.32568  ORF Transcript_18173/g.32568 Transcript_18173/m.32568 type:complete len:492 (-) Transcript_18173:18-1493(-)
MHNFRRSVEETLSEDQSDEDFDAEELLSPQLHCLIEKKLMYFNDPTVSFSMPVHRSNYYQDITRIHQHIGTAKFGPIQPWLSNKKVPTRPLPEDSEVFPEFKREVESYLDEIAGLLEKFQDKVELAEADQDKISREISDTEHKVSLVEAAVKSASKDYSTSKDSFESLLVLGEKVKVELAELVDSASSKLTLLGRITKLEDELVRVEAAFESMHYDYEALKETYDLTKKDYDRRLTSSLIANEELEQQLANLRTVYDELSENHTTLKKNTLQAQDVHEREMKKLQRAYDFLKEELETKEELLTTFKSVVESASSQSDDASLQLQNQQKFHAQIVAQYDKKIHDYEQEIAKMKRGWIRDVEVMNALKIEKETLDVKLQMLDQKWMNLTEDYKAALQKCDELKKEARANLLASSHSIEPNSHSATGSVSRMELEYRKRLKELEASYVGKVTMLSNELDSLKVQLSAEKDYNEQLERSNNNLQLQIKRMQDALR